MRSYDILWLIKPGVNNIVHTVSCQSAADKCLEIDADGSFRFRLENRIYPPIGYMRFEHHIYRASEQMTRHRSKLSFV